MTPIASLDRLVSTDISWDVLSIPFESLPELETTVEPAPPSLAAAASSSPYGREWGWDSELLTVRREEAPPVRCGEPWSIHNTLGVVPPQLMLQGAPGKMALLHQGSAATTSTTTTALDLLKAAPPALLPPSSPEETSAGACAMRKGPARQLGRQIKCMVPDCTSDLLAEREFNLRNKICEFHQKANALLIEGEEHRFCQQCTRLHPISMFDGNKRGCRTRLNKHAKRRRLAGLISKGLAVKPGSSSASANKRQTESGSGASQEGNQAGRQQGRESLTGCVESSNADSALPDAEAPSAAKTQAVESPSLFQAPDELPHESPAAAAATLPHACRGPGCNLCAAPELQQQQQQPSPVVAISSAAGGPRAEFQAAAAFGYGAVEHCVTNFSLKMIGASPDQLPSSLKEELRTWMAATPVALQGYIRFGCLHLSVDVTLDNPRDAAAAAASLPQAFAASVRSGQPGLPWCTNPTTAYFPSGVQVAASGVVVRSAPHSASRPRILHLKELAVADGLVKVAAAGLQHPNAKLLARLNSEFHELKIEALETTDGASGVSVAAARIPYEAGTGFAWLELLHDAPEAFEISQPVPVLVTDCPLISAEVSRISSRGQGAPRMDYNALVKLLQDLALMLHPTPGNPPIGDDTCLRLAGFAASCGWPETMDRALDRALQTMGLEEALEAIHGNNTRLTLLSAAVTSGSSQTVARVMSFMAETGSFELAQVDTPSGACGLSPMQWAEAQGVQEVTEMLTALRNQTTSGSRSKVARTMASQDSPSITASQDAGSDHGGCDSPSSAPQGASVIAAQGAVPRCFASPTTKQSQAAPPPSVAPPKCG